MSYTAHSWQTGETITAQKMNNIEQALAGVDYDVFDRQGDGLVPRPTGTNVGRFLREDGTWAENSYDSVTRNVVGNWEEYPVGDGYSEDVDYTVGTYVIYANTLYVCTTACTADTWENNHTNFTATTIVAELNALRRLYGA